MNTKPQDFWKYNAGKEEPKYCTNFGTAFRYIILLDIYTNNNNEYNFQGFLSRTKKYFKTQSLEL